MSKSFSYSQAKHCQNCNAVLPPDHKGSFCSSCSEYLLFQDVKDFIRSGDYTEYDVAQFFNIPLSQVRKWIREGRIQYKEDSLNNITLHCQICGAQIMFGTVCAKCMKAQNISGSSALQPAFDNGNMHHLQIANSGGTSKKIPNKLS